MNEQVIADLLIKVKHDGKFEKDVIRLLKYIYGGVVPFINGEIESTEDFNSSDYGYYQESDGFENFIDGDSSSILYYLVELINDNKIDFIKNFFKRIDVYLTIYENSLYNRSNFAPESFIFNIYMMLACYHYRKDDYFSYFKFCDEYSKLLEVGNVANGRNYSYGFDKKKEVIDKILAFKDYEKIPFLKELLNKCFFKINYSDNYANEAPDLDELDVFLENSSTIFGIYSDILDYKNKYQWYKEEEGYNAVKDIVEGNYYGESFFWDKLFVVGSRFLDFNTMINDAIGTSYVAFCEEICDEIKDLNEELFVFLNKTKVFPEHEDSFNALMEIVFDSDSYIEILNKISIIKKLNNDVVNCVGVYDKDDVLKYIDRLNSDEVKLVIDGKVFKNPDSLNMNSDEETFIYERMKEIFITVFGLEEADAEQIVENVDYSDSISELMENMLNDYREVLPGYKEEVESIPEVIPIPLNFSNNLFVESEVSENNSSEEVKVNTKKAPWWRR